MIDSLDMDVRNLGCGCSASTVETECSASTVETDCIHMKSIGEVKIGIAKLQSYTFHA